MLNSFNEPLMSELAQPYRKGPLALQLLLAEPVAEFKEFEPRFKSAKPRFKLSAGINLETFDTSGTNHI